jgi:hypothetical protein
MSGNSIFEGAACYTAMAGKKNNDPSYKVPQGSDQGQSRTSGTKVKQASYAGTRGPAPTTGLPGTILTGDDGVVKTPRPINKSFKSKV